MEHAFLLCGGLKQPPLEERLGGSVLGLPATGSSSILDIWEAVLGSVGVPATGRVALTRSNRLGVIHRRSFRLIEDQGRYRGPAGAVRDAAVAEGAGSPCVIAESCRLPERSDLLNEAVETHRRSGDAVTVTTNPDGSFAGVYIAERDAIEQIPSLGFMDLKEQWIPAIAKLGHRSSTVKLRGWCAPIRTAASYIAALARLGRLTTPAPRQLLTGRPGAPIGTPCAGSLISDCAAVHETASVAESVVGENAEIGAEATVVRSVVAPGARVAPGSVHVDAVVRSEPRNT